MRKVHDKYTIRFNDGWDYAIFTIDDTGMFNCQGSFGNYAYKWGSFGDSFKKFLVRLNPDYLYTKLCERTYFDFEEYFDKCKTEVLKLRKEDGITKEQARTLWEFFADDLDSGGNYEITCLRLFENDTLSEVCGGDVTYSEFWPEMDYTASMKGFVENIYPMFIDALKGELILEKPLLAK